MNGFLVFLFLIFTFEAEASNSLSTVNSFGPGASQVDFTSVETSKTLDAKKWSILGFVDAAYRSLAIYNSNETGDDILSFTHLGLSYGLGSKLEIGVKGPVVFNQTSDSSQASLVLTARGFTNIDGFLKYRLVDRVTSGITLMAQVGYVNGDEIFYVGPNAGLNYSLSVLMEKAFGRWLLASNIGYIQRSPGDNPGFAFYEPIDSTITASVGLSRPITSSTRISGELLVASHDFTEDNSDRTGLSLETLVSLHTKFKSVNLSYGMGLGLSDGIATPALRGFLGFQYPFGFPNKIAKKEETKTESIASEKPKKREPAVLAEKLAPPVVSIEEIKKVEEIEKIEAMPEPTPEPMPLAQSESAKVETQKDFVEETTEDFLEAATTNEDPAPVVENAGPVFDFEEPVVLPKKQALIKSTQEFDSSQEVDSLPVEQLNQKIILNNIEFDFDSAEFDSESKKVLGKVLSYLKNNPFKSLEIWGHTDFKGSTSYNESLGLRRAQAVYDLFKKARVPASLMNYDAFGERRPVSLGLTEPERRKNRRVEIIVIRE